MDKLRDELNKDIQNKLKDEPDLLDEIHFSDAEISADDIDLNLAEALQLLEPCGKDNEVPVFVIRNARVRGWRSLKDDDKSAKSFSVCLRCTILHPRGTQFCADGTMH